MKSFKDAAYKVLKRSSKPLHSKEITRIALKRGWLKTAGKTPDLTMNAQLVMDIADRGKHSRFIQTKASIFAINSRRAKKHRKYLSGSRGALIKGMTPNLPGDILTDPVFEGELKKLLRGYGGIYALYNGDKLYYVGLATSLFGRIKWHLKDRHSRKWNYFKIFRIRRVKFLKDIETLVLNIISPKGNRAVGKVPRDKDLSHVLWSVLREYEKKIRPIKRALR